MKKLLICILMAAMLTSCMDRPSYQIRPGEPLPEMEITLSDGTYVTKDSLIQGESLIGVFNIMHPDCEEYLSIIQNLRDKQGKNLNIYLVCLDKPEQVVSEYWKNHKLTLPYASNEGLQIFDINPGASRQVFLLSRWGIVFNVWDGKNRLTENELKENIQSYTPLCK